MYPEGVNVNIAKTTKVSYWERNYDLQNSTNQQMLQKKNSAGLELKGSSAVQQCLRDATSSISAGNVSGDISTRGCS